MCRRSPHHCRYRYRGRSSRALANSRYSSPPSAWCRRQPGQVQVVPLRFQVLRQHVGFVEQPNRTATLRWLCPDHRGAVARARLGGARQRYHLHTCMCSFIVGGRSLLQPTAAADGIRCSSPSIFIDSAKHTTGTRAWCTGHATTQPCALTPSLHSGAPHRSPALMRLPALHSLQTPIHFTMGIGDVLVQWQDSPTAWQLRDRLVSTTTSHTSAEIATTHAAAAPDAARAPVPTTNNGDHKS